MWRSLLGLFVLSLFIALSGVAVAQRIPSQQKARWLSAPPSSQQPPATATNVILNIVPYPEVAPLGCTVDETDDRVYVVDLYSGNTWRFDLQLNLEPIPMPSPGGTNTMTGIAWVQDASGEYLYWVDVTADLLWETDTDGGVLASYSLDNPLGGTQGGMCYQQSSNTLWIDDIVNDRYDEFSRGGLAVGSPGFTNPAGSPAYGNGISHDLVNGGFHITSGLSAEGEVMRMYDLNLDGEVEGILWDKSDPIVGDFDNFVNGHCMTDASFFTGLPSEFIVGNQSYRIIEMDASICDLGPITDLTCTLAGNDVTLNWTNGGAYDDVWLAVDSGAPTSLGPGVGGAAMTTLTNLDDGFHTFKVYGTMGANCAEGETCQVVIGTGFTDMVLAFPETSAGLIDDPAAVQTALVNNGRNPLVVDRIPDDPALIAASVDHVWILCGTYPDNHVLRPVEGQILVDTLALGVPLYLSGNDLWGFDDLTVLDTVDGASASADGTSDLFNIQGEDSLTGLDLTGLESTITMEQYPLANDWIDHLVPDLPEAGVIWSNPERNDTVGVYMAPVGGNGHVISTSFEFGSYDGDRDAVMAAYLNPCPVGLPSNLTGFSNGAQIILSWVNNDTYSIIDIFRDDLLVDTIPGTSTTYTETDVCSGKIRYRIYANGDPLDCGGASNPVVVNHGVTIDSQSSPNTPIAIPDADPIGITDTFEVTYSRDIVNLDIDVAITHSWQADLIVSVTSPVGTAVTLHDRDGSWLDNIYVTYDQDGVLNGALPYACDCAQRPSGPGTMDDFNNEPTDGLWSLAVVDAAGLDLGTLDEWGVTHTFVSNCLITAPSAVTCTEGPNGFAELEWDNGTNPFSEIRILRDGLVIDTIPGTDEEYLDTSVFLGNYTYVVRGVEDTTIPCCAVDSGPCSIALGDTELCNDLAVMIPDNDPVGITSVIAFPDREILDTQARVNIQHTFVGDLIIDVTSPQMTVVLLHDLNLGLGTNDLNVLYSDLGIPNGSPPGYDCGDCLMQPPPPNELAAFTGESSLGDWSLAVSDNFALDEGTLTNWCVVVFEPQPIPFVRADVDGNGSFNALVDGLFLLGFGFVPGTPEPPCFVQADADGMNGVNALVDGLYILNFGFVPGSPPPPPPFPVCATDPVAIAALGCDTPPICP